MNVLKKVQIILLVITLNFFFVSSSYANKIKETFDDLCLAFFSKDIGNKKTMPETAAKNSDTDLLVKEKSVNKAFEEAAEDGDLKKLGFLLKQKIYIYDSSKERAFEIAFKRDDIKMAKFLTNHGVTITEEIKEIGVRIAIEEDDINILKFLEAHEEKVDVFMVLMSLNYFYVKIMGVQTFYKAIAGGAVKIVEFLIGEKGADPNGTYNLKHPLDVAFEGEDIKMVKLLESKGAKLEVSRD